MTETARRYPELRRPEGFSRQPFGWVPWLEPLAEERVRPEVLDVLGPRGKSPYARLLAHDPAVLVARTLVDRDIFTNEDGGLPLAERELVATAASRTNGCVFCASVHARSAVRLGGRADDVDLLLENGTSHPIDARWDALARAAVELTRTPVAFDAATVARLREAGLDDAEIVDLINSAAFFNWANRLMLSLGEPEVVGAR